MKGIKPSVKVLCAILAVCITFFAGVSAFALSNAVNPPETPTEEKIRVQNHKQYFEEAVNKLVQEGKLTKEKADKILEYKRQKAEEFKKQTKWQNRDLQKSGKKGSLLYELKKDGIVTEAEAQAIKEKLREMKDARIADGLQGLVEKGVLNAKDLDNIKSYLVKAREERKEAFEKLKKMSPEERKQYFKECKKDRKDILTKMVEDKVITEEQAKEIRKAIPELNKAKHW